MMGTLLNHPWPYLATAMFTAAIIWYAARQPRRPGARHFGWLMGVYIVWSLAGALSTLSHTYEALYGLFVVQSLCTLLATALQLLVVLEYTGNETWLTRRLLLLLYVPVGSLGLLAFAFPEAMVKIEYRSEMAVLVGQSGVRWGFYGYIAIISLIILGVLFTCLVRAPAFRAPLILLIVGVMAPVLAFPVIRPESITVPPIQLASLLASVTVLAYAVALYSFRILQVRPVVQDMLISRMPYGLLILDSENRLVDFNVAARMMTGLRGRRVLRQAGSRALGAWWDQLAPLIARDPVSTDVNLQTGAEPRSFHVTSLPLLQASGWRLGQIFLLEDVTEARRAQQQHEQAQRSLAMLQEREQLARELHDSLGQVFGFVNTQGQTIRRLLARGEVSTAEACADRLVEVAREADMDIRESILGLRVAVSGQGLIPALAEYLARYEKNYAIYTELEKPESLTDEMFEPLVEVQLLRILQEALTNVRKHANAHCVRIVFGLEARLVTVAVWDDGQGFDPESQGDGSGEHVGLRVMRERAAEVGGSLALRSSPGEGTLVTVTVPVRAIAGSGLNEEREASDARPAGG